MPLVCDCRGAIPGPHPEPPPPPSQATGYQLEEAVNLFFATGDAGGAAAARSMQPEFEDDEALARRLQE